MNALRRYLAEEIATDYVDGLPTRREALHRLALLAGIPRDRSCAHAVRRVVCVGSVSRSR
ncbi:hypothetical protein A5672_11970 [Mycobacterium alsense]|uniref:Uncharacterized protein n=1 Tax=Mycobacterium alsense TaxID=324058 RepID=A0ABD6P6L1_9MYCO|nr:hypothetical protein A5672_11970 [Mycobacterium alsense]